MLKRLLATVLLLSVPLTAWAQTYTVAPTPKFLGLDTNRNPLSSGKLCTYVSGTTTPATTYTSANGIENRNPVILDGAGQADVWLAPGQAYTFVLKSAGSDGTCSTGTTQWTVNGISGVPTTSGNTEVLGTAGEALTAGQVVYLSDGSGGKTPGSWYKGDAANTYSSTAPRIGVVPSAISSGTAGTVRLAGQASGLAGLTVGAKYFVSATAGGLTSTAPANNREVGVADSTSTLVLFPGLPSVSSTSTITTVGTQTALTIPSGVGSLTIFANNATLLTLQGIAAGVDGQRLSVFAIGAGNVELAHQNGSASASARLINFSTAANAILPGGVGKADYIYDATTSRWRMADLQPSIAPNLVMYSSAGSCPIGWGEYTAARGLYVVGLQSGGTNVATVGTALTNTENRATGVHSHGVTDPGHRHNFHAISVPAAGHTAPSATTGANADDTNGGTDAVTLATTGLTINNSAGVAGTNAPFIQMIACQKQ